MIGSQATKHLTITKAYPMSLIARDLAVYTVSKYVATAVYFDYKNGKKLSKLRIILSMMSKTWE